MIVEMACCTQTLLKEISDNHFKRKDVALSYYMALHQQTEEVDWNKINNAIMGRWSFSGLNYIKGLAWKLMEGKLKWSDVSKDSYEVK